jgi:hypothetical protein
MRRRYVSPAPSSRSWPVSVSPHLDEITSSWIVRVAAAYEETPSAIVTLAWGKVSVWNRDADLNLSTGLLRELGRRLGVDPERAVETSLRPLVSRLGKAGAAWVPGLLMAGIYHRTRRRHAQQYCPECLASDAVMLRQWRLAFVFSCPRHGCLLRDACPACDAPVAVHRSVGNDLRRCSVCQASLVVAGIIPSAAALAAQYVLLDAWATGTVYLGDTTLSFEQWLAGLRMLFGSLQRPELGGHMHPRVPTRYEGRRSPLELSRIGERAVLVPATVWLSNAWPKRALDQHQRSPLRAATFIDTKRTQEPEWLVDAVRKNFPITPRTRRPVPKVRVPSALRLRRSMELGPVIKQRLDRLRSRH